MKNEPLRVYVVATLDKGKPILVSNLQLGNFEHEIIKISLCLRRPSRPFSLVKGWEKEGGSLATTHNYSRKFARDLLLAISSSTTQSTLHTKSQVFFEDKTTWLMHYNQTKIIHI